MNISLRLFSILAMISLVFGFNACSATKGLSGQKKLIIGTWALESASVNGTTIPAAMLGGKVVFIFTKDGTATFTTPDGKSETGRYELKDSKIIDPDSPNDIPVDIISLDKKKLELRMLENGDPILMTMMKQ